MSASEPLDLDDYRRPEYDDRVWTGSSDDRCVLCSRPLRGNWAAVNLDATGQVVAVDYFGPDDPEDLGWFGIGPECKNRLPEGYVDG